MTKKFSFHVYPLIMALSIGLIVNRPEQVNNGFEPKKYEDYWKIVDSLEQIGLPRSAQQYLDKLYKMAKNENNTDQFIRVMIYKIKFTSYYAEDSWIKSQQELLSEVKKSAIPAKQILHSMLAVFYQKYFDAYQWQIMQRSYSKSNSDSMLTSWDLLTLRQHIIAHFDSSLMQPDKLATIKVSSFSQFIQKGTAPENLRPTLYDFLLHQAIDFYTSSETDLQRPVDYFNLNNPVFFSDANTFAATTLPAADSLSSEYQVTRLYTILLQFRLNQNDKYALGMCDLDRIGYIYRHSSLQSKDSLYIAALKLMEKQYEGTGAEAEALYLQARYLVENSYLSNSKDIDQNAKVKALKLFRLLTEKFPDSNAARNALIDIRELTYGELKIEGLKNEVPLKPFVAKISYRVDSLLFMRVYKTTPTDDNNNLRSEYDKFEYYKKNGSLVYSEQFRLPGSEDLNPHSAEIILPGFGRGFYMIAVADNQQFLYDSNKVSFYTMQVTSLALLYTFDSRNGFDFYVMNRDKGTPVSAVTITIYDLVYNQRKYQYDLKEAESIITDTDGRANLPSKGKYRQFKIRLSNADESYLFDETISEPYTYREYDAYMSKIWVITDRKLYRPGQTVYFKGLYQIKSKDSLFIQSNKIVDVMLYDPNGQQKFKLSLKTNDMGTFHGSFQLPSNGINGQWSLQTAYGNEYIQVEEYKRPRFEFTLETEDKPVKLGDSIVLNGIAKSFAGASVSDAKVEYSIERKASRWWWWFSNQSTMVATGSLKCNKDGRFRIAFKSEPDFSDPEYRNMFYNFSISVKVSDITGETHSNSVIYTLGQNAVKLKTDISNDIDKEEIVKFTVSAVNFAGKPVEAKGTLLIEKLKMPDNIVIDRLWPMPDRFIYDSATWYRSCPGSVYKDENKVEKLPVEMKTDIIKITGNCQQSFSPKTFSDGYYRFTYVLTDQQGNTNRLVSYHRIYSSKVNRLVSLSPFDLLLLKKKYKPGDNAELISSMPSGGAKLLIMVHRKNQPVSKQWYLNENQLKPIVIPVAETDRGGLYIEALMVFRNRFYKYFEKIEVPFDNKELQVSFKTFRDKLLPGEKESWDLQITNYKGKPVIAEAALTLYDASLDMILPHNWYFDTYPPFNTSPSTYYIVNQIINGNLLRRFYPTYSDYSVYTYSQFNWYGYTELYYTPSYSRNLSISETAVAATAMPSVKMKAGKSTNDLLTIVQEDKLEESVQVDNIMQQPKSGQPEIKIRSNLNETAFFYPDIRTDKNGNMHVEFTIPEALTRWKLIGFAHTANLEYEIFTKELITRKELMVTPNLPRFFREGDSLIFSVKLDNVADHHLQGKAMLWFTNAITGEDISDKMMKNTIIDFAVEQQQNSLLQWQVTIPQGCPPVVYHIQATSGKVADAEQGLIPVLPNRKRVIETMPLWISGKGEKTFEFKKFLSNQSPTINHISYTIDFTPNPAWYAIQALPYLTENENESTERTFSRFFANAASEWLLNSNTAIRQIIDVWRTDTSASFFFSNLERNPELKNVVLNQTPWVMDAMDEKDQKQRLVQLFDQNRIEYDLNDCLRKIESEQLPSGGWPWFEGMPASRFITQWIVSGFGRLQQLGMADNYRKKIDKITVNAIDYLDHEMTVDYQDLKKRLKPDELAKYKPDYFNLNYLWVRSYFPYKMDKEVDEAYQFYYKQVKKYWIEYPEQIQANIALLCYKKNDLSVSKSIVASLSERALHSEEMGMYWRSLTEGWYWYNAAVETQAIMIELFDVVARDTLAVEELKLWLLKNKQTNRWHSSKATVEAVFALLNRGSQLLQVKPAVTIKAGDLVLNPENMISEAGTGYFKSVFDVNHIKPELGKIVITKSSSGPSWGGVYWQYTENLNKIAAHNSNLKLGKRIYIECISTQGRALIAVDSANQLKTGDRIIVRIDLFTDRDLEYVHLSDMRAAALEPDNLLSGYRWRDGLGYYQSIKDISAEFFFHWLPKGTYVFEYPLLVTQKGTFSNGISTVQCLYAPEFSSHSEGITISVAQ